MTAIESLRMARDGLRRDGLDADIGRVIGLPDEAPAT